MFLAHNASGVSGNLRDGRNGRGSRGHVNGSRHANVSAGSLLRAVAGDVACLSALVTGLAGSVERATVGSGAVAGDVTELSTGVALHSLRLAIPSEVVRATALVAGSRASASGEATTSKATSVATTANGRAPRNTNSSWVWARTSKVARLAAVVATTAGAGAGESQGRAVSLDVAKSLAVIALLGFGCARQRALVGLVA